jgi:hypothetical protein
MYIPEKGMIGICLVNLFVTITERMEKTCLFKTIQFKTYRIRGFSELRFQSTEMSPGAAIKEKLPEEFDPCF